jgi:DUF971 family protein
MPPGHVPTEIKLHQKSRVMEVRFDDGREFRLPYEYLRVYSPSAEVRGHGPGQEVLQTGKRNIEIQTLEAVGSYAVQPVFSDGHGLLLGLSLRGWARIRLSFGPGTLPSSRRQAAQTISKR